MSRRLPASPLALTFLLLAGSILVPFLAPLASAYGERPYEWNQGTSTTAPILVYNLQNAAQSFTPTQTYRLLNVSVRISNPGTFPMNVSIRRDVSGSPSSEYIAASQFVTPSPTAWVSFAFPSAPLLTQGTRYWIVATSSADSTRAYRWYQANADTYAGGWAAMNLTGGPWTAVSPPSDLYFLTFARESNANITAGIAVSPSRVLPKGLVSFTVYYNNSGTLSARRVWINMTLPAGLARVSDNASANSTTPYPTFTFIDVPNGVRYFRLIARVDIGIDPGTVLTTTTRVTFADSTWVVRTLGDLQVPVTIGLVVKQLYLAPGGAVPTESLTPVRPTGGIATQTNLGLPRDGSATDFDLRPALARDFRAINLSVTLYLDSARSNTQTLSIDLTLVDWNGVSFVSVAELWRRFTTNNVADFQRVTFTFAPFDHTFPTGHLVRLRAVLYGNSTDGAVLAYNSTFADSHLDLLTSTYVQVDRWERMDRIGNTTVFSPKDPLVVRVNASDPFGSSEITGVRLNITDPGGSVVVNYAWMVLLQADPSPTSVWKLFTFTYGPLLANGTYVVEMVAIESNGVVDVEQASASVRAPYLTVKKLPTAQNVRSGDRFDYRIWINNTSPSSATAPIVWINDTLPNEVNLISSSPAGNLSGNVITWTFSNVWVGRSLYVNLSVQVRGGIAAVPYFTNTVNVDYADEKGYSWPRATSVANVVFRGPVISLAMSSSSSRIHANESDAFTYVMTNTGEAAQTLWLNDTLPTGLAYVSDTVATLGGTTAVSGSLVSFRIPGMGASTSASFTLTARGAPGLRYGTILVNTAGLNYTNSGGYFMPPDVATTSITAYSAFVPSAYLTLGTFSAGPGDIIPGVVDYSNIGNEPAGDVWINMTLDPYMIFVNASVSPAIVSSILIFHLTNVDQGAQHLFLNITVSTSVPAQYDMRVDGILSYTDGYGNGLPIVQIAPKYVDSVAPRITLSVTPGTATVEVGTWIMYTVSHANAGGGTAGDVWLNLSLPASFVYVSDDSDGARTVLGSRYSWHWTNEAPGSKVFQLQLYAKSNNADGSTADLAFQAEYTDDKGNARTGVTATVRATFAAPVIEVELLLDHTEVLAGGNVSYTLRARNVGSIAARDLWLLDSVDKRLEIISYTSRVAATGTQDQNLNWSFTDFAPGDEEDITLVVRVGDRLPARTLIANVLEATFTNSVGTVVGYVRSAPVTMTVMPDLSLLPWILISGSALGAVAVIVVRRRMRIEIEEAFLVYRDGVLMYHLSRSLVQDKDEDVLSGMLTAVQEFVRDAFRYGEHRELHQLDFGDYRIMIERGKNVYLAVVYSGSESSSLRRKVRGVLDHIETSFGSVLEKWDGDMEKIVGARDAIRDYLMKSTGRHHKPVPEAV